MVELTDVVKRYGSIPAVDGISFAAVPGEIFGLIGPNGAGKSTTIRMIMNIILPDSGTIMFSGKPLSQTEMRRIGYLPEERGLYKKETVNDVLLYFGSLKGAEKKDLQQAIDSWLKRFDLVSWKHRKISELSKGMAQKVQFISSVAHDPDLLFFDEPFSGLDPISVDVLREAILELSKNGKTILFSTHAMEQAERLCSRIFLINKGKQVISGTLDEVKNQYGKKTVVIEFDGDGSFIRDLPFVTDIIRFPRWVEVTLSDESAKDRLFASIAGKISVRRFELQSPSLHRIFVSRVGNAPDADGEKESQL